MAESGLCAVATPVHKSATTKVLVDLKDDILSDLGLRGLCISRSLLRRGFHAHEHDETQNRDVKQPFDEAKHDLACLLLW